jgi:hypothetical protein
VVPRRWAFWNHRWKCETLVFRVPVEALGRLEPGAVAARVAVQPGPVRLWTPPPVVDEVGLTVP